MKASVRITDFRAITVLVAVAASTILVVALGVPAAQATTIPSKPIPSGTEVIPYISFDSNSGASSINLYDPVKRQSETISGPDGTDSFLWQPQLSEDGKKVLFLDYHDFGPDPERQESIGFMPSAGGERTRIVTVEEIAEYDLSRDGSKVLYTAPGTDEHSTIHLFTAPVEGNATPTEVPIPSRFASVTDVIFNKDGTDIFFTGSDRDDPSLTGNQLYSMKLDGTEVTKLTDFTSAYNPETFTVATPDGYNPQGKELSPDGNTVAYYGSLATDGTQSALGIYTLPVSGGTPKEVAVPSPGRGNSLDLVFPHYNHAGSKIMYSQGDRLYSVSAADGKNQKLLADGLQFSGNWEIVNIETTPTPDSEEPAPSGDSEPEETAPSGGSEPVG
jgi:Tol biopolymer transport system component